MLDGPLRAALLEADVIGIGEHGHGDVVSWPYRLAAVAHLRRSGRRVAVLCENLDFYVEGLRRHRPGFRWIDVEGSGDQFIPHATPFANRAQHLAFTRRLRALVGPDAVYGIDVQALRFPRLMTEHDRDAWSASQRARWRAVTPVTQGRTRNALNAEAILAFRRRLPRSTALVYLAQNEHVALDCDASRADPAYRTDGAILRAELGARYLSIATYEPVMSAVWPEPTMLRDRRPPARLTPDARLGPGPGVGGKLYRVSDFDRVLSATVPAARRSRHSLR